MNERSQREPDRPQPLYAAFLVRCWREGEQWRFLLENVTTRKTQGFDSFEALYLYLERILKDADASLGEPRTFR